MYNTATGGTAPNNVWPGFYYWDGAAWVRLDTGNGDWKLDGNSNGSVRTMGTNDNFDLPFETNGSERMRIVSNGNVGIGTPTPVTKLHVVGTHPGAGSGTGSSSDAPTEAVITAESDGATRLNDWPNTWGGGLSTWDIVGASTYFTGYVTRSDARFKKDIKSLPGNVVEKFMMLNPVSYYLNPETLPSDDPGRLRFGFIANEIEELFPNIVANAGMPKEIKRGLEYDAFIPLTVKVVQEQQKIIDAQNEKLKELEKRIMQLEKQRNQ